MKDIKEFLNITNQTEEIEEINENIEIILSERLLSFKEIMSRPFVQGRDLIEAGLTPGRDFTEILAYAHKLRLAGIPKDSALKQTLSFARKLSRR